MGYVKKRIRELIKEAGSKKSARSDAESWFTKSKQSNKFNEAISTRGRFEPGKIYSFKYSPVSDLDWFDRNPVVLAIEHVGDNDLGVNLNLLPVIVKEELLDDLYTRFEPQIKSRTRGIRGTNAGLQKPLRITYAGMKNYLKRSGCDFAIRQYKPEKKNNQAVVSYDRWPEMALCDFISLSGATVSQVRKFFRKS